MKLPNKTPYVQIKIGHVLLNTHTFLAHNAPALPAVALCPRWWPQNHLALALASCTNHTNKRALGFGAGKKTITVLKHIICIQRHMNCTQRDTHQSGGCENTLTLPCFTSLVVCTISLNIVKANRCSITPGSTMNTRDRLVF